MLNKYFTPLPSSDQKKFRAIEASMLELTLHESMSDFEKHKRLTMATSQNRLPSQNLR